MRRTANNVSVLKYYIHMCNYNNRRSVNILLYVHFIILVNIGIQIIRKYFTTGTRR